MRESVRIVLPGANLNNFQEEKKVLATNMILTDFLGIKTNLLTRGCVAEIK